MSLGYVVVSGFRMDITALYLKDGRLQIEFSHHGRTPEIDGPLTIFGEDGIGIMQGSHLYMPASEYGIRNWCSFQVTRMVE